jgi:hypothetical protein
VLQSEYHTIKTKSVVMNDETLPQSYYFCIKNALKLTYEHLYFKKKKNFRLAIARHEGKGKQIRKGRGGEGEGKGKRTRGYSPQIWNSVHAPSCKYGLKIRE